MRTLLRRACLASLWVAVAALAALIVVLRVEILRARKEIEALRLELREIPGLRSPPVHPEVDDGESR